MTQTLTDNEVVITKPDSDAPNGDTIKRRADLGEIGSNRWYHNDQRVIMNTPGKNDGIIQGWVDSEIALDKRDQKFRNTGFDHIKINEFWLNVYMGGGWVSTCDCHLFVDKLVVSPIKINSDHKQQ